MSAFDLIVRGGVIVNHAGRGEGDIGVRDGKIAAIGNVLRHEYERVDPQTMWEIATVKLPQLEKVIERMLAELEA